MKLVETLLGLLLCLCTFTAGAQVTIGGAKPVYDSRTRTYLLTVPEADFGNAYHAPVVIDDGVTSVKIDGKTVTDEIDLPLIDGDTCYTFSFTRNGTITRSTLHFTYLPILCLTGTFSDNYVVGQVEVTFPDGESPQLYRARVKWAGASTNLLSVHKRNYHLKFIDDDGEKLNVSFFGLREDNHWRLDAGTRDMIRFRNKAAHDLWSDFGAKPYYADSQPKARSYVRGSYVEVFLNGSYNGIYNMTEFLDRKQMKLKKYDVLDSVNADGDAAVMMHGMMWKGKSESVQTLFISVGSGPVDNTADSWGDFDLVYPDIEEVCPTDYSVLYNAVNFVATANNRNFTAHVEEYFDLPVLVNYYVFIHALYAIDNTCKNIIWSCYDMAADKKITPAVWDLDVTVGQHWSDDSTHYHADVIQPENELDEAPTGTSKMSLNQLFNRLKALTDFKWKAVNCYWRLRETVLDPDSLVARYQAIYDRLDAAGALGRETERWSDTGDIAHRMLEFDEEMNYLCDWLRRRIAYLDANTFACRRGDVDNDGFVNISDVTKLISYVLNGSSTSSEFKQVNADVNGDDVINIVDITLLIDMILNGTTSPRC